MTILLSYIGGNFMDFKQIKEQTHVLDPKEFLTTVLTYEQKEDDVIIFSQTIEERFEQAITYLSSESTISLKDLTQWKENNFLVVAQTIDGDYIAGNISQTFIIPVSLYKADIETYELFLSDFFVDYSSGLIDSTILPTV